MAIQECWHRHLGILDGSRRPTALATPESAAQQQAHKPRVPQYARTAAAREQRLCRSARCEPSGAPLSMGLRLARSARDRTHEVVMWRHQAWTHSEQHPPPSYGHSAWFSELRRRLNNGRVWPQDSPVGLPIYLVRTPFRRPRLSQVAELGHSDRHKSARIRRAWPCG